jgi:hypothetical protein
VTNEDEISMACSTLAKKITACKVPVEKPGSKETFAVDGRKMLRRVLKKYNTM